MKRILIIALLCITALDAPQPKNDYRKFRRGAFASRFKATDERKAAFARRESGASMRTMLEKDYDIIKEHNCDEKKIPGYKAMYSKGLEHDPMTGLLTTNGQKNYRLLLKAITSGDQKDYNAIALAPGCLRKLVNPQASAAFSFVGIDSSLTKMPLFPSISSIEGAAQLTEVYLQALARDVAFEDYGTGKRTDKDTDGTSITHKAARILTDYGAAFEGPLNGKGKVDASTLFRGNENGTLVGPYVSQFLYHPMSIPKATIPPAIGFTNLPQDIFEIQQLYPIVCNRNFGISEKNFAALQNGQIPELYKKDDYKKHSKRYIVSGRDLACLVHYDYPYEWGYNALRILYAHRFLGSPANPYVNGSMPHEDSQATLGFIDVFAMVGAVSAEAGKAAWAHKWRAQRVLRPEEYANLVHRSKKDQNTYHIAKELLRCHDGIDLLKWVERTNMKQGAATCLMPLAYPEGSPLHPSYPSGHATLAGAYITILKAMFDDTALFSTVLPPVKPDPKNPSKLIPLSGEGEDKMTIGGELNKLASNIAFGRNFAGIHYRADADQGMRLGEAIAISYLQDHACCLTEQTFKGFELTTLDGIRIRITGEKVEEI